MQEFAAFDNQLTYGSVSHEVPGTASEDKDRVERQATKVEGGEGTVHVEQRREEAEGDAGEEGKPRLAVELEHVGYPEAGDYAKRGQDQDEIALHGHEWKGIRCGRTSFLSGPGR